MFFLQINHVQVNVGHYWRKQQSYQLFYCLEKENIYGIKEYYNPTKKMELQGMPLII